jgi:hypothetical protein
MKTGDFAKSFVKDFDKNRNGWLDGDELKSVRGKPAEADLNKDGVITVEELTTRLSTDTPPSAPSPSKSGSGGSGATSGQQRAEETDRPKSDSDGPKRVYTGSTGSPASATKEGDKRHSYRFRPAAERLPSGLPGWFASKDANRDGQVSMSEYSRSWSKSTVADFRRFDVNDDGIVTAKEAAKPSSGG